MWPLRTTMITRAQAGSRLRPRITRVGGHRIADDLLLGLAGDVDLDPARRRRRLPQRHAEPPRGGGQRRALEEQRQQHHEEGDVEVGARRSGTPASVGIAARKIETAPRRPTQETKSFSRHGEAEAAPRQSQTASGRATKVRTSATSSPWRRVVPERASASPAARAPGTSRSGRARSPRRGSRRSRDRPASAGWPSRGRRGRPRAARCRRRARRAP